MDDPQLTLVKNLWWGNLAVFGVLTAGAFILAPWFSALSVAVGGVLALVNFRLLGRTLRRAIRPGQRHGVMGTVLIKYYLRFAATAVVIWILVRQGLVEPLGLLVGLSVVVISIMIWGACQARKLYKEAY
ncbi:MAG: ATP synthase subunit I [Desulfarculaceae bacterium]|jgi:hypothetical protein